MQFFFLGGGGWEQDRYQLSFELAGHVGQEDVISRPVNWPGRLVKHREVDLSIAELHMSWLGLRRAVS